MSNPSKFLAERLLKEAPPGSLEHNMAKEVLARLQRQTEADLVLTIPPPGDGWQKWSGRALPPPMHPHPDQDGYLNELVRVDVVIRSGQRVDSRCAAAYTWLHRSTPDDIVWVRRSP